MMVFGEKFLGHNIRRDPGNRIYLRRKNRIGRETYLNDKLINDNILEHLED